MGTNYIAPIWRMPRNANKDKLSNYSIEFDGSSDYIDTNDNTLLSSNDWSISLWFKWSSLQSGNNEAIVSTRQGSISLSSGFDLYLTNNDTILRARTYNNGVGAEVIITLADEGMTTDVWYHASVVYGSGTLYFKINNGDIFSGSSTGNYTASTNNFLIGKFGNGANYHAGSISEVVVFDYALSTNQITYLYNLDNPMAISGGEPIAYWPLGDNSNPNAPGSFPNISVGADSVFDFDSSNTEQITGPSSSFLDGSSELTISGWIKLDAPATINNTVVADLNGSGGKFYILSKASSGNEYILRFGLGGGSNTYVSSDTGGSRSLTAGQWDHFVFTFNAQNYVVYINGQITNSGTQTGFPTQLVSTSNNITIGNRPGQSLYWNGELSNVQIWDKELTEPEALQLYNNGQPLMTGTQPQESNLKAWYKLNQSANYDPGVGPWSIEKVGSPDDGSGNGCFTSGGQLKWIDTNSQLLSENDYFTFLSPLISCNSIDVDLSSTGGSFQSASSQLEYALEYSIDGGSWTTWKTQVVGSGTPVTNWTVSAASNLTCNKSIQVRLRATGGLFGTSQFNWNDLEIKVNNNRVYFETFGTNGLGWTNGFYTEPTDNYIDPVWQIPDAVSEYPHSFSFSGSSQRIKPGTNVSLGITDAITVSAWVRIPTTNTGGPAPNIQEIICEDAAGGSGRNWGLNWRGGSSNYFGFTVWHTDNTVTSVFSSGIVPNDGKWHHVIGTFDGTTNENGLKLYVDNTLFQNTANGAGVRSTFGVHPSIGSLENGTAWMFEGNISNVYVWETDLNSTQVETLYNNGVPSTSAVDTDNLKLWYKLDNTELFDGTNWIIQNQKTPANYESALYFTGGAGNEHLETPSNSDLLMAGSHSFSVWLNVDLAQVDGTNYIFDKGSLDYSLGFAGTALRLIYYNYYDSNGPSGNNKVITLDPTWKTKYQNGWNHVVVSVDQPNLTITVTTNGTDTTVITTPTPYVSGNWLPEDYVSPDQGGGNLNIMSFNGVTLSLAGYISNLAFYNGTILTTSEALTLYNNGTPENNISFSPTSWWKIDNTSTGLLDNAGSANLTNTGGVELDTYVTVLSGISTGMTEQNLVNNNVSVLNGESSGMNSTNLVTSNISRTQPYSNYSFNFDSGQSDYFNCGDADIFSFVGATNDEPFSVSAWVNFDDVTGNRGIIGKYGTTDTRREWLFYIAGSQLRLLLRRGASYRAKTGGTTFVANTWYHLLGTYDGRGGDDADNGIKLYVNGLAETLTDLNNGNYIGMQNTVEPVDIGRFNNTAYIDGKISNTALFDRVLTEDEILNIYNNGVPQDLQTTSTFSNNIIAWWPMDDRSSYYDGTDWVIRDLENGNDGDGNNTGNVNDLVGNAPGSDANGSGNNLAIADLKGDMKDSKLNAFSINMADYADSVTNPANSGRSTEVPSV